MSVLVGVAEGVLLGVAVGREVEVELLVGVIEGMGVSELVGV